MNFKDISNRLTQIADVVASIPQYAYIFIIIIDLLGVWYYLKWRVLGIFILLIALVCFAYSAFMNRDQADNLEKEDQMKKKHVKQKKAVQEEKETEQVNKSNNLFSFDAEEYSKRIDKALGSI